MRKLTGLFIAAAVAGGVWWQLPHQAGRPLAAQTGRPSSGDSRGASTGVRVQTPPGAAYSDAARRLMAQAQAEARKGNTAEAKRLALQASRFPVQWTQGEVSPSQLLQQLNGGAAPAARLNPGAIAGRQPVPTRQEPADQTPGVPSRSALSSGASNSSPIQQAGGSSAVQGAGTGTEQGIRQVGYKAPPTPQPSTATDPLKRRVDDYMTRAYAAWQSGDHQEALRLASVADVLAEGTNFAAGEETPAAFIARVRGGQAPKGRPQPAPAAEPEEAFVRNVPVPAPAPAPAQPSPVDLVEYQPGGSPAAAADPQTEAPALMPTITAAGSSAPAARSTEPGLLPAPEKSAGVNPAQQQIAAQRKEYASGLMAAAREDMQSGQLEAAYEKALLAAQSDVAWNLFEETPEQLVAEIARRQKQSARTAPPSLVRNEPQPEPLGDVIEIQDPPAQAMSEKSTAASGPLTDREAARNLLAEARGLLAEGRFDEARSAAFAAKNLPVTYSLFEDRPEQVLRDIDRASGTLTLTDAAPARPAPAQPLPSINPRNTSGSQAAAQQAGPATESEFAQTQAHDRAQQLLKDARGRMRAGDFETARSLAQEAQKLNTSYSLFDERPEVVLADIDRLQSRAVQTASAGSLGASMAAAAPVSRPQTAVPTTPPSTTDRKPALLPDNLSQPQVKNPFETAAGPSTPAASDLLPQPAKVAQAPQAAPAAATGKPSEDQQKAARLLAEARELVQQNRLEEARAKAEQAGQLDVVYDLFADQPSDVLAEIARLDRPAGNTQIAQNGSSPASQPAAPDVSTQREQARQILEEARAELSAGQYEAALAMAEYVRGMDLTFGTQDDRPELVINDALKMKAQAELAATGSRAPSLPMEPAAAPPSDDAVVADTGLGSRVGEPGKLPGGRSLPLAGYPAVKPGDNITILHPSGQSADALFRQGQQLLRQGDRQGAHQAFLSAWQSGQKLDAYRSQQLQDYLRELAPKRTGAVQLTSGEQPEAGAAPEIPSFEDARPIDIAAQRDQLKFDRLRTETLNAMLRADTLREKRPDQALEVLDQALAEVENSGYETEQVAPLVRQLRRSRESIEGYMAQRAPIIELNKRNEEVKDQINRERDAKVRVEQEFASLVDEYNRLYREKRYADAGMIARQAKELDPTNPVAVNMELKAKLAFRIDSNDKLRDNKEESFWKQLDDVEQAAIVKVGDANPAIFPDNWEALSRMRAGRYRNDNRNRTETEKKIEESLNQKISLHYENAKLIEIIQYIRTATGMNVVIDQPAIEDEGVTTESVVSIDVNDIMVQSALNLLLNPINLGYSIENESLLITSQIRQQGRLVPAVYPVADLVVSMRDLGGPRSPFYSLDGANQSVSPGMQNGGLFQVGPNASPASFVSNQGGLDASLNGSAQNQYDFNTLVDLITSVVEPDSWQEVGGLGTIKSNETTLSLVIRQTRQVHDEISDLLDQLRRLQDLQVTIEVRLINVSDRFFERIGIDFDFDLQDTVGGPDFITGGTGQGGGGGGGGGQQQQGNLTPIPPFGTVLATQQQGQQQQGQQQGQQQQGQQQGTTTAQFFTPQPAREFTDRDRYQNGGTIIGLSSPNTFTPDLDVAFQQGSFDIGVPDFGNFMPNAGLQVGLAILSDIETFFFINAAQGDERSNILFAPKVTLFNGGRATISDSVQRPFVVSLQPTVGAFSVGFSPQIQLINDGISLTVTAVVSADRRFVRLALQPFFNNLIDLQTFSFIGGTGGGLGQAGGQAGGQLGGGQGGFGGGGQGGFGGGGGGQFGVGGIGGGPGMGPAGAMALSRFGRALGGGQLVGQNPQFGFGGIGGIGGGLGGGLGGGQGGFGGGQQQGQAQGGLAGVTATVQQPVIASITVSTSVSVPDGGTVLLGGVKRLREGRNMAGVPILNKIPYISRLFKNSGVGRETESLMLMVTPRIVIYEEEMELLGVDTE